MPRHRNEPSAAAVAPEESEESESDDVETQEDMVIEQSSDAGLNDLVLDFRTVTELPYCPDTSGVKAFRAFIFQKGKVLHFPGEVGKYLTSGEWYEQWTLCKVFFKPATKRDPELLLSFVDYGMLSNTRLGISVESLTLPLRTKKNVYNDTPRLTQLKDVAGFSSIDPSKPPWSIHLAACLKKNPLFVAHDVLMPKHLKEWLVKKDLGARLNALELITRKHIAHEVEAMRKQDERQAEKTAAIFISGLTQTMARIRALPPSAYDVEERVFLLGPDADAPLPSITTPIRQKVLEGDCDLVRTRLAVRIAPEEPIVREAAATEVLEPAADQLGEEDGDDPAIPAADVEIVDAPGRVRRPTDRYEAELPTKKPKKAAADAGPRAVGAVEEVLEVPTFTAKWGMNPRTGKPYQRAPYRPKPPGLKEMKSQARDAVTASLPLPNTAASDAAAAALAKANSKCDTLRDKNTQLMLDVARLERDLAVIQSRQEFMQEEARAKGAKEAQREVAHLLVEAKHEYKKGLADGASLAKGKPFSLHSSTPRSTASGSSFSSKHRGGRKSYSGESPSDD